MHFNELKKAKILSDPF